ncbi:MAG: DEAD/DEAH box helicase [Planctomycetota bacterium]
MQTFESLGLSKPILDAVTEEGYTTPTPIQAGAIPPALEGKDVLGLAQTGTGKTAAFTLPVLDRLVQGKIDKTRRGPKRARVLVLSPTRELATQIGDSMRDYGRHTGLRGCIIYGGVSQGQQVRRLRDGVDIIVATPGRLMDLMDQGHVDLSGIEIFVLDEVDRMLDMGFIQPIRQISEELPEVRQSLMFSATLPRDITRMANTLLNDPVRVEIAPEKKTEQLIEQSLHMVEGAHKPALLEQLLDDEAVTRAVVFTKTKHGADKLSRRLSDNGVRSASIHGNKTQAQRQRALDAFRAGRARVLVATDVAARGLDVDGISHVFNYNLPNEPEAYVHRIGRTGRAGATGYAVSFCDSSERSYLRAIERLTGQRLGPDDGRRDDRNDRPKSRRGGKPGGRPNGRPGNRSGKNRRNNAASAHGHTHGKPHGKSKHAGKKAARRKPIGKGVTRGTGVRSTRSGG